MADKQNLRIAVLGLRGIPNVQGGVETHCQELYPRIARYGHKVTIFGRSGYISNNACDFEGVKIRAIPAPRKKSLEAIIHTTLGVMAVAFKRSNFDLLHIHAIGPSLLTPWARLAGIKVVVTNHGPDYDRQKWGSLAKFMLYQGERLGSKYAYEIIAVSKHIRTIISEKYGIDAHYIPNGVILPQHKPAGELLKRHGLSKKKYLLAVGRLVPEKGFHDLIEAFANMETDWKLVIAGDADHEDEYSRRLKAKSRDVPNVVMTGFVKGDALGELYSNAGLFVLPSYHEGLPLVLLEAMSYELPVLVSDIPANKELAEESETFPSGNVHVLKHKLQLRLAKVSEGEDSVLAAIKKKRLIEEFDWNKIAETTLSVYQAAINSD